MLDTASLPTNSPDSLITVLENMPALLVAIDHRGRLVAWNHECERCTGYAADEVLGRSAKDGALLPGDVKESSDSSMWSLFEGTFRDRNAEVPTKDGRVCVVSWSNISEAFPVPGWSSWAVGIDVTRFSRDAERAERLQRLTATLSEAVSLEQVAEIVANNAVNMLGAHIGIICLVTEDGKHLNLLAHRGVPADLLSRFPNYPIDGARFAIGEAVRLRRPLWFSTHEAYEKQFPELTAETSDSGKSEAVAALPLSMKGRTTGVIGFAFPEPHTFNRQERAFMLALAHQCAQALERAQLLQREAASRKALQIRIQQQSSIAKLGLRALRADVQTLMDELVVVVAGALGVEYAKVLQLVDNGERFLLRAGTGWHEGLIGRLIITAGAKSQAGFALLNKGPVIVNDLRTETRFEDPDMLMEHGVVSGMSVILETRRGPYGVLGAHTKEERVFTEDDIYFLQAAANILGEAIEREQVVQAEQLARLEAEAVAKRIARLQELTVALSESLDAPEIARVVVDQGMATIGANYGMYFLLSQDTHSLEAIYARVDGAGVPEDWQRFEVDPKYPVTHAVETGEPLWFETITEANNQFPDFAALGLNQIGAAMILPLVSSGRSIGAVAFAFSERRKFSPVEREFMMTLAHQCAQATERALLYQAERKARLAAEKADQLKLKFLAMVSHELRTPLTSIKGFISSLIADDVSWPEEQVREFLAIADAEADKLTSLVEQLLDLSRLEAGTLAIEPKLTSIEDILAVARPQLEVLTARHDFRVIVSPELPPVRADQQRIAQVLANLVSNGVKYGPPSTAITVTAWQVDNCIRIDVSDEGEGIPPEQREFVFEAFRQGDGRHGGAGLGLAICKGLVEAHGGNIWIEDTGKPGATIAFTLPVA